MNISITDSPLSIITATQFVQDSTCGAIATFIGTTRDTFNDKVVLLLEYQAYEPLAIKSLNQIAKEAQLAFPGIKKIYIQHRIGKVPIKEASVVIAVSSVHRKDGILAMEYLIDELKKRTPIWKKEIYKDDPENGIWKQNCHCFNKNI